jgi:hypothetical protein
LVKQEAIVERARLLPSASDTGGASVPSQALHHAVDIAGDAAKVHCALATLDGSRHTLSVTPFSWEAEPQPVSRSDPRHIKTAG